MSNTVREIKNQSAQDLNQFEQMEQFFQSSPEKLSDKIDAFPKFCSRQAMAKFLTKYEIFSQILGVNGSIIECGVLHGSGLFSFAKLSSILEPTNHTRRIVGFDTFQGFPSVHEKDTTGTFHELKTGGLTGSSYKNITEAVDLYDANRPLSHIPKVELVQGDLAVTAPDYAKNNPHLVVALLYLDLDLYEPTKVALETFVPLMPKGAIIVFDELNAQIFPGETRAVDEVLGLRNLKIERFYFDSYVSYAVL